MKLFRGRIGGNGNGRVVVATRVGGIPERLPLKQAGWSHLGTLTELTEAISLRFGRAEERARQMGLAGHKRVLGAFSQRNTLLRSKRPMAEY